MRLILLFVISMYLVDSTTTDGQSFLGDSLNSLKQNEVANKKVLILTDSINDNSLASSVDALELYNLLGHFKTTVSICNNSQYRLHNIEKYDVTFYIGYNLDEKPSSTFMKDVIQTRKTVVWINAGLRAFNKNYHINNKYGFFVSGLDTSGTFNSVYSGEEVFTRGVDKLFQVQINNNRKAEVIATAFSGKLQEKLPYIVRSGNFYYVADIPFLHVTQSDRYLLFADLLHEMIGENHPVCHQAIVRIEDVTPNRNPQKLIAIADILSDRHIPFLIGVIPFFVDPAEKERISLSDRPELVKALKYCVEKGATIVLHGVTHQYKGISGIDFEFWDGSKVKPIADETSDQTENKIETGINECIKNGIYPLIWETPHYTASISDYKIFSGYFSSSIERRMLNEDYKYGQFFPYVINKDMYGQKIYPEDLGYIPFLETRDSTELFVHRMINNAKAIYNVRDGYASFFFHPFVEKQYLIEVLEGISDLGFTFIDLRKQVNKVSTKDVIILSGSQTLRMNLDHSYLYEVYYNKDGVVVKKIFSKEPITGVVSKKITLKPDEFYLAEPMKKTTKNKNQKGKVHSITI